MGEIGTACDIAHFKYPRQVHTEYCSFFILDQNSCHKKYGARAAATSKKYGARAAATRSMVQEQLPQEVWCKSSCHKKYGARAAATSKKYGARAAATRSMVQKQLPQARSMVQEQLPQARSMVPEQLPQEVWCQSSCHKKYGARVAATRSMVPEQLPQEVWCQSSCHKKYGARAAATRSMVPEQLPQEVWCQSSYHKKYGARAAATRSMLPEQLPQEVWCQSSYHKKCGEQEQIARNILVRMEWHVEFETQLGKEGSPQSIIHPNGFAKGLRTTLREREVMNTSHLKADELGEILSFHKDFYLVETVRVRDAYSFRSSIVNLTQLDEFEEVKVVMSCMYTNCTYSGLKEIVNPAPDSVSLEFIRKYIRKIREYEKAFLEGTHAGKEVEGAGEL